MAAPNIISESVLRADAIVSVSFTPANVTTATCAEQDVTVTGVAVGDYVTVNPPAIANAIACCGARVKAANTVAVLFSNPTGSTAAPGAGTYTFRITRPYPSAQSTFMTGSSVSNTGPIPLAT